MKQTTLAIAADQAAALERTRHEATFLAPMDSPVPWSELGSLCEPHYPKVGNGRPPIDLTHMPRIYLLQHSFNLADQCRNVIRRSQIISPAACSAFPWS